MKCSIVKHGLIFEGQTGSRDQSAVFPQLCVTESGRWLCAFRAAPRKKEIEDQHVLLRWSDDYGDTWSDPLEPFFPTSIEGRPGLIRSAALTSTGEQNILAALVWVDYSNPEAPFFNEATEGLLDCRILLSRSRDSGLTWSAPALMDTTPFTMPTPLTGPILRMTNGELACQFELNKHYHDPEPWVHKSVLMFSPDDGISWPEHSVVSHDPRNRVFYWDQRPAVLRDGRILDLFWTFDRKNAAYLNIHSRESADNGRTWSEMRDLGIPGQPAPPVQLADGRLALVYVDRTGAPLIKCRTSMDGRRWPDASEIIIDSATASQSASKTSMQDAWAEMAKFSIGLPTTALLPDGNILVAYYQGSTTDTTAIRWAVLR